MLKYTFASLFLALPAFADQTAAEQAATEAAFRAADLTRGQNFEVVFDVYGDPRSVIGKFDVGLDSTTSFRGEAVGDAVAGFISKHASGWGFSEVFRPVLVAGDVLAVSKHLHVTTFEQYWNGLKVLDGEVTAGFWPDGTLQSFNGRLGTWENTDDAMAVSDVIRSFAADGIDTGIGSLERGLSLQYGGVVWMHRNGPNSAILDEATRVVVHTDDSKEHVTAPCNVTRRDFPRVGGLATQLVEGGNNLSEQITCEASDVFGTCYWELRREPSGFTHGIGRVLDNNDGEQQDIQACSSTSVPQFTGTNGDALREQGAFYVENQMRFFIDQNVWSQVAFSQEANVRITVDNANVVTAQYDEFFTDIDCNNVCATGNCCSQDVLSHEYGHYVTWTYGGNFDDQCTAGTEEGNALDETLANVFGHLFWLDDDQTKAQYGAIGQSIGGTSPSAHTNVLSIRSAAPSCPNGQLPNVTDGAPFQQAVWELMFNRDCSNLDVCTSTSGVDNSIWTSLGQEGVLTQVGAALGAALSVLGANNITHDMVRAQMRSAIISNADPATGTRAQRVFSHHGLTCPNCCTGC